VVVVRGGEPRFEKNIIVKEESQKNIKRFCNALYFALFEVICGNHGE
jgi:hypothetical protein